MLDLVGSSFFCPGNQRSEVGFGSLPKPDERPAPLPDGAILVWLGPEEPGRLANGLVEPPLKRGLEEVGFFGSTFGAVTGAACFGSSRFGSCLLLDY